MRWRAALTVAAVYGHFLIFAQFSFIEILRAGGAGVGIEKGVLAVMACGGIAGGFLAAWRGASDRLLKRAMLGAGLAAGFSVIAGAGYPAFGVALLSGISIGVATVSLAALLPRWCRVVDVGLGTGLGYAVCNLPFVFMSGPVAQAWIGAGLAVAGCCVVPSDGRREASWERVDEMGLWMTVAVMTALVWLDSAAFFIIQHTGEMRTATWGEAMLWRNAGLHLGFACLAGWWIERSGARLIPLSAWVLLASAVLALNAGAISHLAGWLYPGGVSLYSVLLVVWAGAGRDEKTRAWRAAVIFGIAGWFGSANGIGMAEKLERVPLAFLVISGGVVAAVVLLARNDGWRVVAVALVLGALALMGQPGKPAAMTATERGRKVYLSEGCIHCHTQYTRPDSLDEGYWGKATDVKAVIAGRPVLIGNRRQGPDLSGVGGRRSAVWLKEHFMDPRRFAPDSPMSSYSQLFEDGRGDDLVAYLSSLGRDRTGDAWERAAKWKPEDSDRVVDARALYARQCAVCHGGTGSGDGSLSGKLTRGPANLLNGPFVWTAERENVNETRIGIARVIKFGVPGTDMPGHETLGDAQVLALADYLMNWRLGAKNNSGER